MTLVPVKTPLLVKKMFPNYIWDMPTNQKIIYLTFDDGPTPEITHWTLNALKKYNAKATFFCIGNNIKKLPDIFHDIVIDGHRIGNHTYNHLKGWKSKTTDYLKDIEITQKLIDSHISETTQTMVNLFRPPYGRIKSKQARKLIDKGYKIVMWDVLAFDWDQNVSNKVCLKNVLEHTVSGSIIVFHDSVKASKNMQHVLPKVLEHYSDLGYVFKAL